MKVRSLPSKANKDWHNLSWTIITKGILFFVFLVVILQILLGSTGLEPKNPGTALVIALLALALIFKLRIEYWFVLMTILLSIALSGLYHDIYFDGITYHQSGIFWVAWDYEFLNPVVNDYWSLFVSHYPKLSWIYGAAFLGPFENVVYAKSINFLLFFAVFFLSLSLKIENKFTRLTVALMFAASPIAVNQIFSGYVDGLVAQFFTLVCLSLVSFRWHQTNADLGWIIGLSLIALPALKFTGLLFSGLLFAATLVVIFTTPPENVEKIRLRLSILLPTLASIALLVLFNPYITNVLAGKHPLHPAFGDGRLTSLISGQTTDAFYALNPLERLHLSLFAESYNLGPWSQTPLPVLKLPFTFSMQEVLTFSAVDTRVGGWGPLFLSIVSLSALLLIFLARHRRLQPDILVLIVTIAVSIVLNPESWWARYSPQFALLPNLLILAWLMDRSLVAKSLKSKVENFSLTAMVCLILANAAMTFFPMLHTVTASNAYITAKLNHLRTSSHIQEVVWEKKTINLEPFLASNNLTWRLPVPGETLGDCIDLYGESVCASGFDP